MPAMVRTLGFSHDPRLPTAWDTFVQNKETEAEDARTRQALVWLEKWYFGGRFCLFIRTTA